MIKKESTYFSIIQNDIQNNKMKLILLFIAFISIGCKQTMDNIEHSENRVLKERINKSVVVSCGSGCTLVYNLKQIKKESKVILAEFDVTQYIDEKITDNYPEKVKYVLINNEVYEIYIGVNLITEYNNGQLYSSLKKLGNEISQPSR